MITLLRHRNIGEPSCSRLVRALNALDHDIIKVDDYDASVSDTDLLIRWGHTGRFPLKRGAIEINTPQSINRGSDKGGAREILQDAGVSVPRSFFTRDAALAANTYPLIGRPSYHTQGRDVEFIKTRDDLSRSSSSYWSEFIKKDREFRVYVFGGRVLGVVEKTPENKDDIAWNSHRGAVFTDLTEGQYPSSLLSVALDAARAVGQFFSGVDIMTRGADAYVLELNSSLALSNAHRVDLFARAFGELIDERVGAHA